MEQNNNNIMESDIKLRGLYILSAPLLDEKQVIKFGMTECLQNRIYTYKPYLKTPYYMACYNFNNNFTKKEITAIETIILNITLMYKADDFTSEYRRIKFEQLHDIVCDYLNKNGVMYTIFIRPIWKYFNKNKKIKVIPTDESKAIINIETIINPETKTKPEAIINKGTYIAKYQCDNCTREFKRREHLTDHLNKKNRCQQIIPINIGKIQLNSHNISTITNNIDEVKIINNSDKPILIDDIKCNYCNKTFARNNSLYRHVKLYCHIVKQQNEEKQKNQERSDKIKQLEVLNNNIIAKNEQLQKEIKNKDREFKKEIKMLNNKINKINKYKICAK